MGRPSKKAKVVRKAGDFDLARLLQVLQTPHQAPNTFSWTLEDIREARDQQALGVFRRPAQLAKALLADDALFVAKRNRLAPLTSLGVGMIPSGTSALAVRAADEAAALYGPKGVALTSATIWSIHSDLVDHGIGIGVIDARPRDDGSRIDLFVRHWPIEWVQWDPRLRCLVTEVAPSDAGRAESLAYPGSAGYSRIPIVHGDGRWIVISKLASEPWSSSEACVIPAGMIMGARQFGLLDWGQNSRAHGSAKIWGELPEGVALVDSDNNPTVEAAAFLAVLQSVMSGSMLAGLRPAGAKTDFVANAGTAWQVFSELVGNRERAAARVYLGTDGTLGSQGGAPGVDISELFGIAATLMQGDVGAFDHGFFTGLLQPWAALNYGDSTVAPSREYELPDTDAQTVRNNFAARMSAFQDAIAKMRSNGFDVTQAIVDMLAKKFLVPAPVLPESSKRAPTIALAPTDLAVAVRVNEARASAGLGPLTLPNGEPDPDGLLPLSAYKAKVEAAANLAPAAAPPPVQAGNGAGGAYRARPDYKADQEEREAKSNGAAS